MSLFKAGLIIKPTTNTLFPEEKAEKGERLMGWKIKNSSTKIITMKNSIIIATMKKIYKTTVELPW